jgi:NAD dependent epimerase/dehydratase
VTPDPARSFAGKSVLVTGAGGFIGGHLTARLVEAGARVRGLVRYNSRNDWGTLEWLDDATRAEVDVVLGDLRDIESIARAVRGVETVFHLGAQIAIPYSYVNPRDFFETNVLGSFNVAQAALAEGVSRVVHTSSSEVYGTAQSAPITEDHPLDAQSPYAASKIGADKLMIAYHRSFDLPATVLRPFNTYGPFQSPRAVIPTIILQALNGGSVTLGSLDPTRDLTYVSDTVDGFLAVAQTTSTIGMTLQLGTGDEVSVKEIVETVGQVVGRELEIEHDPDRVRPPNSEVERLISSPERVRKLTGWAPAVDLLHGLTRTMEWLRSSPWQGRADQYVI